VRDDDASLDALLGKLGSAEGRAAEEALVARGTPALSRLLALFCGEARVEFTPDADPRDVEDALSGLLARLGRAHADLLFEAIAQRPELSRSGRVLWALQGIMDERALGVLRRALGDRQGTVRWAAVVGLAARGDASDTEALAHCLKDRDGSVRFAAIEALGRVGDARAIPALQAALADRKRHGSPGAPPAILAAIEAIQARGARGG
jgi:HEAT repeat protein